MSTLPKLAELTPTERRVLCAEAIGWWRAANTFGEPTLYPPNAKGRTRGSPRKLPDPDTDFNAALALVEHLRAKGWVCQLDNGLDGTWECTFRRGTSGHRDYLEHYAPADIFQHALTSAFLLAKGLAQ